MHTRSRAAATTALLLTASVTGLAANGGSAQARTHTHTAARAASKLVVTIKENKSGITLSDSKFRPGNTIFKVAPHGKGGDMQVLRLKSGYTLVDLNNDIGPAFGGDIPSIKRIDRNVVFYGGNHMKSAGGDPTYWGVKIDKAGTYYVLDVAPTTPILTTFKAKGDHQKRSLPAKDGWINMATASDGVTNVFRTGKNDATSGWMSSTNHAKEPHFVDLAHVKKSTTTQQVRKCFKGTGPCNFRAADHAHASTGVISPGKTMIWSYSLTKGKFLVDCFWPSKMTGLPHALMGMFKLFHLV
jgi:hypothetical protein